MADAFDPRLVRVGIQVENDFIQLEGLDIRANGSLLASPTASTCTVKVSNLTKDYRNFILSKATPQLISERSPVFITLDIGRQSYGLFRLFEGTCYASGVTQPPDIGVILQSVNQSAAIGLMGTNSQNGMTQFRTICQSVATQLKLVLDFKATDRMIANYNFTGSVKKQLEKLQNVGDVRAFIDNKVLVVIDKNKTRSASNFVINMENGMVGVPQSTQSGATVQILARPDIRLGDGVTLESKINPSVNGSNYYVAKIDYNIANRDNPFFYTLTLSNQKAYFQGTT